RACARGAAEVGPGGPLLRRGGRQEPRQDVTRMGQGAACSDRPQAEVRARGQAGAEELDGREGPGDKGGEGGMTGWARDEGRRGGEGRCGESRGRDGGRRDARSARAMRRWFGVLPMLVALLGSPIDVSAATTVKLPPPDLTGLIPLAALPLDKPPVPLPAV